MNSVLLSSDVNSSRRTTFPASQPPQSARKPTLPAVPYSCFPAIHLPSTLSTENAGAGASDNQTEFHGSEAERRSFEAAFSCPGALGQSLSRFKTTPLAGTSEPRLLRDWRSLLV